MQILSASRQKFHLKKISLFVFFLAVCFAVTGVHSCNIGPKPSAYLIRELFTKEGIATNNALEKFVPFGITSVLNESYDTSDKDCGFDVYYPDSIAYSNKNLPTIVWIHGGGFIAGSKDQVANYCKILASKGFTVVAVNYSLAPEKNYPLPVIQVNKALQYLKKNAAKYHIDINKIALAGDSAGAHIASQTGFITYSNSYSQLMGIGPALTREQLKCVVLFCGPYDIKYVDLNGSFAWVLNTFLWSYSGNKDFANDELFKTAFILEYVNKDFPPAFISVGNNDPLRTQSYALARKLSSSGANVDSLFYPDNYTPALEHEYQFNLNLDAGKLALEKMTEFLQEKLN